MDGMAEAEEGWMYSSGRVKRVDGMVVPKEYEWMVWYNGGGILVDVCQWRSNKGGWYVSGGNKGVCMLMVLE